MATLIGRGHMAGREEGGTGVSRGSSGGDPAIPGPGCRSSSGLCRASPAGGSYRRTEGPGAGSLMVCNLPSALASVLTAKCFASKLPERAIPEGGAEACGKGSGHQTKGHPFQAEGQAGLSQRLGGRWGCEDGEPLRTDAPTGHACRGRDAASGTGRAELPGPLSSGRGAGCPGPVRAQGWGWGLAFPPAHDACSDHISASPCVKGDSGVPRLLPRGKGLRLPGRPVLGGAGQSFVPR